jgi:hypothetical protein
VQFKLLRWLDTIRLEGFGTVRENVIIAYRGTNYELGQWPQGYGIWAAGSGQSQPNEWWPATPEGWSAAWYRFVAIEVPGTIAQVSPAAAGPATGAAGAAEAAGAASGQPADSPGLQPFVLPGGQPHLAASGQPYTPTGQDYAAAGHAYSAAGPAYPAYPAPGPGYAAQGEAYAATGQGYADPAQSAPGWMPPFATAQGPYSGPRVGIAGATWLNPVSVGLLIFGVVCGVIGLFPTYIGGSSLLHDHVDLVPHLIYLAGWALAAVLIGIGGTRQRTGALLGLGLSAVTFGLFFADAGFPLAHGAHSAGMGAGLVLGVVGWLGCAAGSLLAFGRWPADWPRRLRGAEIALAVTMFGAAIGAAITFAPSWDRYVVTIAGAVQTVTEGNAFLNPGPVIVGDVATMVAVVAVLVAAALWRPARLGWALAAGALIPMIAQLISALIQISEPALSQLKISAAEASRDGITATAGFTGWFWAYCVFVIVLVVGCGLIAVRTERFAAAAMPAAIHPAGPAHGAPAYGAPAYGAPDSQVPSGDQPLTGEPSGSPAAPASPVQDSTAGTAGVPGTADPAGS